MFEQTFDAQDPGIIALLVLLEGVLSIDNALVLALLAKRLPKHQQARALTYGLAGAFLFRFFAIGAAAYLLRWRIVKLIGGGYLVWIALRHLLTGEKQETPVGESEVSAGKGSDARSTRYGFWSTVVLIELTDIAFAIDSILAAIAVVGSAPAGNTGPHPKLWVVITGGLLGVVLMRIAAAMFIRLLERFPRFETSAYLLVAVIGAKLLVDWGFNTAEAPHRINFHEPASVAFWAFWLVMTLCIIYGFLPKNRAGKTA